MQRTAEGSTQTRTISIEKEVTGYGALRMLAEGASFKSLKQMDELLVPKTDAQKRMSKELEKEAEDKGTYTFWTSTPEIREAPNVAFGKVAKLGNLVFEIPEEFQGKKNAAIVLDPSSIKIEERNDGTVFLLGKVQKLVENIPTKDGWYPTDKDTGIPIDTGEKVSSSNPDARYYYGTNSAFVGLAVRGCVDDDNRRDVALYFRPDVAFGVVRDAAPQTAIKEVPQQQFGELVRDQKYELVHAVRNRETGEVILQSNEG